MQEATEIVERRTVTDVVFERLYEQIATLALLPGTKLSEVEVARRFGVSRQPVRDAFNRLAHLDLLLIRPQKATEVRGFILPHIANARFVRLAVELEVVRRACRVWDAARAVQLGDILERQRQAIDDGDIDAFHALDYAFHERVCALGGHPLAFQAIEDCKKAVDRLCRLSLGQPDEARLLLQDHRDLSRALGRQSAEEACAVVRRHLGRLDGTIDDICRTHPAYFE